MEFVNVIVQTGWLVGYRMNVQACMEFTNTIILAGLYICAGCIGELSPGRVEIQVEESGEAGGLQPGLAHRRARGVPQLRPQPTKSNATLLRNRNRRVAHLRDI